MPPADTELDGLQVGLLMPVDFDAAEERRTLVDLDFYAIRLVAAGAGGHFANEIVVLHVHDVQRAVVTIGP